MTTRSVQPRAKATPIQLSHADLERSVAESAYRSVCPICQLGLLMVHRNRLTLALMSTDRCTRCGQRFLYTDETIAGEAVERHSFDELPATRADMHLEPLTAEQEALFKSNTCPDCGRGRLIEGPHGGLSVNYTCSECKHLFCDCGPFGVDRVILVS